MTRDCLGETAAKGEARSRRPRRGRGGDARRRGAVGGGGGAPFWGGGGAPPRRRGGGGRMIADVREPVEQGDVADFGADVEPPPRRQRDDADVVGARNFNRARGARLDDPVRFQRLDDLSLLGRQIYRAAPTLL